MSAPLTPATAHRGMEIEWRGKRGFITAIFSGHLEGLAEIEVHEGTRQWRQTEPLKDMQKGGD